MNKLIIIGNLTKDPELRTTTSGINVCSFTVAVNKTNKRHDPDSRPEADYFRVTAWRELGDICAKWLIKGKKVCVVGSVSVSSYTGQDGKNYANLEVLAQDVEFLSPAGTVEQDRPQERPQQADEAKGFTAVETDELPF